MPEPPAARARRAGAPAAAAGVVRGGAVPGGVPRSADAGERRGGDAPRVGAARRASPSVARDGTGLDGPATAGDPVAGAPAGRETPAADGPPARRLAILGVGLIGGSLGLRWRHCGAAQRVVGWSRHPETLRRALELGAIDEPAADVAAAVRDADAVVLCAPILACIAMAPEVVASAPAGCLITDVGSTKAAIARVMAEALAARAAASEGAALPAFVGGHPMAGSERTGVEAADPYLFEQAVWAVCPPPDGPTWALSRLCRLVAAAGAHAVVMDAETHDARVAAISHLPQLAAVALAEAAGAAAARDPDVLHLAGGGFRDTTRIAQSPPGFWLDVLDTNRAPVLEALDRMAALLAEIRRAVAEGDRAAVAAHFERARQVRARVPARGKGLLPAYHDLVLFVPDRPGVLGRLCSALGDRGINVQDIEILRLREGEGGTLRLGFASEELAQAALAVLAEIGYRAQPR